MRLQEITSNQGMNESTQNKHSTVLTKLHLFAPGLFQSYAYVHYFIGHLVLPQASGPHQLQTAHSSDYKHCRIPFLPVEHSAF